MRIEVKLTFIEPILGTSSADPEIHKEFIASKAPDAKKIEEEVAAVGVESFIEKTMTVFPRNDEGKPFFWDYQIKGFMKDACGMLRRVKDTESSKITSYKKVIDGLIFPEPRKIIINLPPGELITSCQRPLRAQTAQGERITLANSEQCPEGSNIVFSINLLDDKHRKAVIEWFNYGSLRGLGQWRNSGKGRFLWQELGSNCEATQGEAEA